MIHVARLSGFGAQKLAACRQVEEKGAHLNLADHLKRTPLLLAIERGDVRLVEALFVLGTSCVERHMQKIGPLCCSACCEC